jgi:hypothetical protein
MEGASSAHFRNCVVQCYTTTESQQFDVLVVELGRQELTECVRGGEHVATIKLTQYAIYNTYYALT